MARALVVVVATAVVIVLLVCVWLLAKLIMDLASPCWWNHADAKVIQNFGTQARRIGCPRCGDTWYVHDGMMICKPWGKKEEELYRDALGFTLTPWVFNGREWE